MNIKNFFVTFVTLLLMNCSLSVSGTSKDKSSVEKYGVDPKSGFSSKLQNIMSYKINQDSVDPAISLLLKDNWVKLKQANPVTIRLNTKLTYGITDGTKTEEVGSYDLKKVGNKIFNPSLTAILSVKAQEKFAIVVAAVYDGGNDPKQNNLGQLLKQWKSLQADIKDDSKSVDNLLNTDAIAKVALGDQNAKNSDTTFVNKKSTLKSDGNNLLKEIKEKNKQAGQSSKKTGSSLLDKGYHNSGFMYFYYPKDGKIYYLNKESNTSMNIYKMNLDGSNSEKALKSLGRFIDARYLYIHKDTAYISSGMSQTKGGGEFTSINLDGGLPNHYGGSLIGMVKVIDDRLYYFEKNSSNYDLYSVKLKAKLSFTSRRKEVDACNCYVDAKKGGNFYVKNKTIYYSDGVTLHQSKASSTSKNIYQELSPKAGSTQNLVFTKDFIYYRTSLGNYGIGKSVYDNYKHTLVKDTIEELTESNALNVSKNWMVYYGREKDKGLYSVSLDGKTEKQLVKIPYVSSSSILRGEVKIIGDWAYYMLEEKAKEYTIYRVKKDGTGKAKVKTINLP